MIDSHQHFWRVARGDYGWMQDNPAVEPIRRDYLPPDLDLIADTLSEGLDATVLVQAAPTVAETDWLLALARDTPRVARVVGWVDFEVMSAITDLERFARDPAFAGVRPMVQDLADDEWMHRHARADVFAALLSLDLTFDALGFPRHFEPFARLFERYPELRAVIDHGMKPGIAARDFDAWAMHVARIADTTPVYMKLSGLLTEARPGDGIDALQPYVEHLFDCFGPGRLMWGSDWPVLTLVSDYAAWHDMATALIPPTAHEAVFDRNARAFYRIPGIRSEASPM